MQKKNLLFPAQYAHLLIDFVSSKHPDAAIYLDSRVRWFFQQKPATAKALAQSLERHQKAMAKNPKIDHEPITAQVVSALSTKKDIAPDAAIVALSHFTVEEQIALNTRVLQQFYTAKAKPNEIAQWLKDGSMQMHPFAMQTALQLIEQTFQADVFREFLEKQTTQVSKRLRIYGWLG